MDMRLPSHCETCNSFGRHRLSGPTGAGGADNTHHVAHGEIDSPYGFFLAGSSETADDCDLINLHDSCCCGSAVQENDFQRCIYRVHCLTKY